MRSHGGSNYFAELATYCVADIIGVFLETPNRPLLFAYLTARWFDHMLAIRPEQLDSTEELDAGTRSALGSGMRHDADKEMSDSEVIAYVGAMLVSLVCFTWALVTSGVL